jgi:hypothetical protein
MRVQVAEDTSPEEAICTRDHNQPARYSPAQHRIYSKRSYAPSGKALHGDLCVVNLAKPQFSQAARASWLRLRKSRRPCRILQPHPMTRGNACGVCGTQRPAAKKPTPWVIHPSSLPSSSLQPILARAFRRFARFDEGRGRDVLEIGLEWAQITWNARAPSPGSI